mmetsp:Transcript_51390/g.132595  ORF Transcript_51390/g.132595 Transcript_51390/m.132595 type:complete len:82 (+) Transcript_51390:285-530(+)
MGQSGDDEPRAEALTLLLAYQDGGSDQALPSLRPADAVGKQPPRMQGPAGVLRPHMQQVGEEPLQAPPQPPLQCQPLAGGG